MEPLGINDVNHYEHLMGSSEKDPVKQTADTLKRMKEWNTVTNPSEAAYGGRGPMKWKSDQK